MADWVTRLPAPPLRPFIDSYIGYRLKALPPGIHRGLPSRHLTFIVSLGEPISVVGTRRYEFVVGGLQATPAFIARGGDEEGVAVELTPLGSRALLGMPAGELWGTSVEAADVLGRAAVELRERMLGCAGWAARFTVCDEVLGRRLGDRAPVAPEVQHAWRALVMSGGTAAVGDLAEDVGWSRRHLTARFSAEFGLAPKLAARVIRFERARRMLQGGGAAGRPGLAEVAATCGYYDQPHLNRDFVELAGCPPLEWLAGEFPIVQDGGGGKPSHSAA